MTELSTAAWMAHDLGLAAQFGGNLFGKVALHPAVQAASDETERALVVHEAWDRYKWINAASLATMAATWLIGRAFLSGREAGRAARVLTVVKDSLVSGAAATGIATMVVGNQIGKEVMEGGEPIISGSEPAPETSQRTRRLMRAESILGSVNLALAGGIIAATAALAMLSGKSPRWRLFAGMLP